MLLSPLHPGDCDDDDFNDNYDIDGYNHHDDDDDGSYPIDNHQIRPAGGNGDAFKDS